MKKFLSVLLAMSLLFVFGVSAFAASSPSADTYYTVETNVAVVGSGKASATPSVLKAGETSVLTAVAAEGYVFDHWEIDGAYKISQGTVNDATLSIVIVPDAGGKTNLSADVVAVAHFKAVSSEVTTGEQVTAKPDNSSSSPQTGVADSQALFVVAISVIGLMAVALIYKKRTEKTK